MSKYKEEVDRLGRQYFQLSPEKDRDVRRSLEERLFALLYKAFPQYSDAVAEVYIRDWPKYDPRKGELYSFFAYRLSRRDIDLKVKAGGGHSRTFVGPAGPDGQPGEKTKQIETDISLDSSVGEDSENQEALWETVADKKALLPEVVALCNDKVAQLAAMVLNFQTNYKGRAANDMRLKWFRIFYTEDMTTICQMGLCEFTQDREVFNAMLLPYLDYYTVKKCRCTRELAACPFKKRSEVLPGHEHDDAELALPFPAELSLAYLERCENIKVGPSARSNQLKEYKKEKKHRC